MHKEFSLLLTVVGVCVDVCTISPRPVNVVWLTSSTMDRRNDESFPLFFQNGARDALGVYYGSRCDCQTQCAMYNEIRRTHIVNSAAAIQQSRSPCSPGLRFGKNFSAIHRLNEFTKATAFSRLLTVCLSAHQTSSQLDQLPTRLLIFTLFYILTRGSIFTDLSTMSTSLLYFELSFVIPSLTPVQASLQPSSAHHVLTPSPAATSPSVVTSTLIVDNYLLSRDLPSTISSVGLRAISHIEPSTVRLILSSNATDVPAAGVKGPVPVWYKQGPCTSTFIHFNNNCYKFFDEALVFNKAARICKHIRSNIISILSQEENVFIRNLTAYIIGRSGDIRIWLGLERLITSARLQWTDNNALLYENWALGEPDGDGACVEMSNKGKWRDTPCDEKLRFICKTGLPGPPHFTRSVELVVMVGIPLVCVAIMLVVVSILFVRSIKEADGTAMGFGETTDKETIQTSLVNVTASIAHVSTQGYSSESRTSISSGSKSASHYSSPCQSPVAGPSARYATTDRGEVDLRGPEVEKPEEEKEVEQHEMVIFRSNTSLASVPVPSRFQSTTSLDHLVSKSYIKPKSRRLRSLRKAEGVVSPAGREGKYVKKET